MTHEGTMTRLKRFRPAPSGRGSIPTPPFRKGRWDIAWLLGLNRDVLDPIIRYREIENWVEHQVLSHMVRRS